MVQDASSNEGRFWPRDTGSVGAESPFSPQIHAVIADHKLLRPIGRGSYGEVWLARHTMGMYRAVKIVHRRFFQDRHPFERELSGIRKFEPISRSHEGFIDILHVGMNEGGDYFYYVMELGDDQKTGPRIDPDQYSPKTLARELSGQGTLDYRNGLQLGLDLSRALAELHRNGLVHRDIKPSNILFVNGVPKLADIGLVSQADEAHSYVGTEGFIPLEGPGTARADVYALGKVLYEAITGKDRLDFPELPLDWDGRADHEQFQELNEIILHACDRIEHRYPTAQDMHADLVVLLAGKSVRRLRTLERQFAQLKRVGAVTLAATAIALGVLYLVSHERSMALQVREGQIATLLANGNTAMDSRDVAGALPYFAEAREMDKGNRVRELDHEIRLGSVIGECPKIVQMWRIPKEVAQVSFSADGQRVLAVEWRGSARIFNVNTRQPITSWFGQTNGFRRGTFSHGGKLVVTASEDNVACVRGSSDGGNERTLLHTNAVLSASFSPDDGKIVTSCTDNQAWVWQWDGTNWTTKFTLAGHTNAVLFATFSHDGKFIATGSRDYTARIWDAVTGRQVGEPLKHPNWVQFVAFSPDDQTLATGCDDHKARLWNLNTRERILPDLPHDEVVSSIDFSPDGRFIVTGSFDGTARIWSTVDHLPFTSAPILRHSDRVWDAAFSADGHRIVTGCSDGTVRIWDLAGAALASPVHSSRISQDKSCFLTISNGVLQIWDTSSREPISPLIRPGAKMIDSRLSEDGTFAISLSASNREPNGVGYSLEVFKCQSGVRMGPALLCTNALDHFRLSNDGKHLLTFGTNFAETIEVTDGHVMAAWQVEDGPIHSALFNPAGTAVALWSDQVLTMFDTATGHALFEPLKHPFPLKDVEFCGDGLKFVTCGADNTLGACYAQVWDSLSGKPIGPKLAHGDGVLCSTFSPDGRHLLTGGEDSKAFIWDIPSGLRLGPIKHKGQVMGVDFSRDGKTFVTASLDKTARLWSAGIGYPLTPPLLHHWSVKEAKLLPDRGSIVTLDMRGRAWIWRLTRDQRPFKDLFRLSRLLSGEAVVPSSHPDSVSGESLMETWNQVRTRHPADVTVSDEQVANWYDFQADESESEGNPQATAFYLERLMKLRPGDSSLAERFTRARSRLANPN
jgi:WD40 repeat protein